MNNTVKIDYLAVTIPNLITAEQVIEKILLMSIERFSIQGWGINHYQRHYACAEIMVLFNVKETLKDGVYIVENGDDRMGVHVLMKGKGCRQYEEFMNGTDNNWVALFQRLFKYNTKMTRLDIANDIYNDKLNVQKMYRQAKEGLCICDAKTATYYETFTLENGEIVGETLTIGKVSGKQEFCIYNKRMEQIDRLSTEQKENIKSWIRAEFRVCKEKADILLKDIASGKPLKDVYFEAINGHYRFVARQSKNKNRFKRESAKWWIDYIETRNKTILSVERKKTTLKNIDYWIDKQVSKSLAKLYQADILSFGLQEANNRMNNRLENGTKKLTENDYKEIEQFALENHNDKNWGIKKTT